LSVRSGEEEVSEEEERSIPRQGRRMYGIRRTQALVVDGEPKKVWAL
jgi:hypothetical protein